MIMSKVNISSRRFSLITSIVAMIMINGNISFVMEDTDLQENFNHLI